MRKKFEDVTDAEVSNGKVYIRQGDGLRRVEAINHEDRSVAVGFGITQNTIRLEPEDELVIL